MKLKIHQQVALALIIIFSTLTSVNAQQTNRDIPVRNYLKGAVPEQNGLVIFTRHLNMPGASKAQVYNFVKEWMTQRLERNKNEYSRLLADLPNSHTVVGMGAEWIVFTNHFLSLDRAQMTYIVRAIAQEGGCEMRVENIRYRYEEKERYTAEDVISDKNALSKDGKKLVRGYAKWRKGTIDFVEELFDEAQAAMNIAVRTVQIPPEEERAIGIKNPKSNKIQNTTKETRTDITIMTTIGKKLTTLDCEEGCNGNVTNIPVKVIVSYEGKKRFIYCTLKEPKQYILLREMKKAVLQLTDPESGERMGSIHADNIEWIREAEKTTLKAEITQIEEK